MLMEYGVPGSATRSRKRGRSVSISEYGQTKYEQDGIVGPDDSREKQRIIGLVSRSLVCPFISTTTTKSRTSGP